MDLMKSAKKQMRKKAWETLKKRRNTKKRLEKLNIKKKIKRKRMIRRVKVASVLTVGFCCRHLLKKGVKKANQEIKELIHHDEQNVEVDSNGLISIK